MNSYRFIRLLLLGVSTCAFVMTTGCHGEKGRQAGVQEHAAHGEKRAQEGEHSDERITLPEEALQTIPFKTVVVQRRGLEQTIQATAVIEPDETRLSHVSPRVPGRVIDVQAFLGNTVKAGQILAELDSLELGQAKAEYLKARADLEVAEASYAREQRLFKQQISSEKDYLDAKNLFLRANAQFKASREALRLLGLADKEIKGLTWGGGKHPLSHFPLLAPFSGTVVEKHIGLGEFLKPEDKPYTIADLSTLWIQLDIYEKDLRHVDVGTPARLQVDAYPEEVFQGTVTYVADLLDEQTRTARARVEIPNPDRKLKPGMFATAVLSVPVPGGSEVLAAPEEAIYQIHGKPTAFVQKDRGMFVPRTLTLGRDSGAYREIVAGLWEGERIVTEGGFYLKSTLLKEEMGEGHGH